MAIAIIGAGVAGAALAVALRRQGWTVHVFERATELPQTGLGYALAESAVGVLHRWGFDAALAEQATALHQVEYRAVDGSYVQQISLPPIDGHQAIVIERYRLLTMLLTTAEALGAQVHWGHAYQRHTNTPEGVEVSFENGAEISARLLLGADGVHSRVRHSVWGPKPLRYAGYYNFRGPGPMPAETLHTITFTVGPHGHIVSWNLSENHGLWSMFINDEDRLHAEERRLAFDADQRDRIRTIFADDVPPIRPIIEGATTAFGRTICDLEPLDTWSHADHPHVMLVGDAAHPTTPHMGAGAAMAIEDAACLAEILKAPSEDVRPALKTYEEIRRPTTTQLITQAYQLGQKFQAPGQSGQIKIEAILAWFETQGI